MNEKRFNLYSTIEKAPSVDDDKGIAYIEGWASKNYDERGKQVVDYDEEIVSTVGFDISRAKTLLYMHDHEQPIGKIDLEHRPEGIYCKAEVHKAMNDKAYYGVKNEIITGFSIGFIATEMEITEVDGEDYVTFTKGYVLENSLVSVGSNPEALITDVKSIVKDKSCTGLQCSIKQLKKANPEVDCDCDNLKKQKEGVSMSNQEKAVEKETEQESPKEEPKQESEQNAQEGSQEQGSEQEKPAENSDANSGQESSQDDNKDSAEDDEKGDDQKDNEEIAEQESQDSKSDEGSDEDTGKESDQDGEEESGDEESSEEADQDSQEDSKPEPTIQDTVGYLSTVPVEELSAEEIRALYDTLADTQGRIEEYVEQELAQEQA